jgi:myo-inositol-1(or 4)-monophosphatase
LPETDLELLIDAARAAAEIAMAYWRQGDARSWAKSDDTPVTEADLAVDAALRARLTAARPDYGWLSEESPDDPDRLGRARVFVVDPIDGTRDFAKGGRQWAHALAVVEDGAPIASVILLPLRDALFAAARGQGATRDGSPIRVSARRDLAGARVLATRASMLPGRWTCPPPRLRRENRASLSLRLARVAEGRFDATFSFRATWDWDIAPGALIAAEAGAAVTDMHGGGFAFNAADPRSPGLIVAPPALHGALRRCMITNP